MALVSTASKSGGGGSQTLAQVLALGNDAGGVKIANLGAPTVAGDAATLAYVGTQTAPAAGMVMPTGGLASTYDRADAYSGDGAALTSGTVNLVALWLRAGTVVTSITFI